MRCFKSCSIRPEASKRCRKRNTRSSRNSILRCKKSKRASIRSRNPPKADQGWNKQNSEGRSVSEAPLNFDGDKPNSVRLNSQPRRSFISPRFLRASDTFLRIAMRRYPEINGPAILLLFCLAPHGVFPAVQITLCAVSSYLAFSPLPDLCCQRTGGVFSVTLSVTAVLQLWHPRVLRGMLPYGVRTFLQRVYGSPAIARHQI